MRPFAGGHHITAGYVAAHRPAQQGAEKLDRYLTPTVPEGVEISPGDYIRRLRRISWAKGDGRLMPLRRIDWSKVQ